MTFSIVARDAKTGAVGVATATGGPVVGSLVPHARAGVGAIATQAMTNALFGLDGLAALEHGNAQAVLDGLLVGDAGRETRQVAVVDRQGICAVWTGADCTRYAGALVGEGVAVAGNMLVGPAVLAAMIAGFAGGGALADRLLAAMVAGQAAGGDQRGTRSAALKVYTDQPYPAVDLRCDWSDAPVAALGEILRATRAAGYAEFFATLPKRGDK